MAGKKAAPELRALAVARAMTGESFYQIARDLGIAQSTVHTWLRHDGATRTADRLALHEVHQHAYYQFVHQYTLAALRAINVQMAVLADPEYLQKQSILDLGKIHNATFWKAARAVQIMTERVAALPEGAETSGRETSCDAFAPPDTEPPPAIDGPDRESPDERAAARRLPSPPQDAGN